MPTILLSRKDVPKLINMSDVITVVETAFKDYAEGKEQMPPKVYLTVKDGDFRAMPASLPGAAGIKWVNVHPGNPGKGLPTVMAVLIYSDPVTGYPLAIMDATEITAYRTAATSAIASKYLARKESKTLGIVGAGFQAYYHIIAHGLIYKFEEIRVCDIIPEAVMRLTKSLPDYPIKSYPVEQVVKSDIVCTLTPARKPVVRKEWVSGGTHINAVGADAAGKEELEPSVLNDAVVVVDEMTQAVHGGEVNVPISKGLFTPGQIYGTLGEIITARKKGRTDNKAVTIFDSTGLAIEDIAVAKLLYEKAQQTKTGLSYNLVD